MNGVLSDKTQTKYRRAKALAPYVAAMTKTWEQVVHAAVFMAAVATIVALMVL